MIGSRHEWQGGSRPFVFAAVLFASIYKTVLPVDAGTSGSILNIPVGARAIAMGEAYTAMADDASSLHWNPAGLAILNQSQASFMYNPLFDDLTYHNASLAVPVENGGLGASVSYLSYGNIEGYDPDGNRAGDVNAYSGVVTFGGAWLGNNWSAGVNLKEVQESLADVKANGFAADMGASVIYPHEIHGATLRGAFTLRNLGTGLRFIDQTDPFPRQWRVGLAAARMMKRKLNVSMDYGQERDRDGAFYVGSEYWAFPYIALRTGYAGTDAEGSGLRAGVGLKFRDLSFDYAYSQYGDLGSGHRYELSLRFGPLVPRLGPEERDILRRAKLAMRQGRYGEATALFDALIQLVPDYRPARRMVKVAMAGYENQERANATPESAALTNKKPMSAYETDDLNNLELMLSSTDNDAVPTQAQTSKGLTQEKP